MSAPASISSRTPSAVTTFPATTGIFGEIELDQSVNIFKSLSDFDWEIRSFYDYSYYTNDNKITCLLELKKTEEEQWSSFKSKLRSQIKSGQKHPLEVFHGGIELLPDFYHLYTRNMFRLGSPPLPILFFKNIFKFFGLGEALITLVRLNNKPVAAGFMLSYINFNEVCWASSDIEFNKFNVNMVLYWEMIKVSISKGNGIFSFGRSSKNSSTLKFKLQWGCNVEQIYMNNSNKKTLDVRNISVLAKLWKLQTLKTSIYFGKYIAKFVY